MSPFGWAGLGVLALYLAAFFWAGRLASEAAGRPIWLLSAAKGRDRAAAMGFRLAFALALLGPLVWTAVPALHKADPFWSDTGGPVFGLPGHFLTVAGAMLAFAAQVSMGVSWRVGVQADAVGPLVSEGLNRVSRNPTFLGQLVMLGGLALAIPSVPTFLAVPIFWASANIQIRSEERVLARALGAPYHAYLQRVPRWIGRAGKEAR